jgi:O-antigen/teichoic acid export membrane protein
MGVIQKSGFWTTVVNYTGAALGFVCLVILYPIFLNPEQVGLTQILKAAATIFVQFSCMGSSNIVLRFFPFFRSGERQFNGIFTLTLLISLVGIITATLLYVFFQPAIINYYQKESSLFIQYSMLVIPISIFLVFYTLFSAWLRNLMKVIVSAIYIDIILRLLFIVTVLIYALDWISFDTFIKLFVLCYAVPAIGLFVYCRKHHILSFRIKITSKIKEYFKPAIKYGLFCLFAGIGTMLVVTIDTFMLGGMIGLASVAVYSIANNLLSMLQIPYRAFSNISAPLVAEYWKQNDMKNMQTIYQKFTLNIVIVSIFLFLLIWHNLDSLYLIMPEIYAAGKWVFFILFIGKIIDIAMGLNWIILNTSKKYVWDLYFAVFLIITAIIFNWLFIPIWGINGAALATTLCVMLLSVLKVLVVKKFFHIHPFTNKLWIVMGIGAAACLLISIIPVFLHWTLDVIMRCGLAIVLYMLPVYLLKISNEINSNINRTLKMFFPNLKIG